MGIGITMIGSMNPYLSNFLNGNIADSLLIPILIKEEAEAVNRMDLAHYRIGGGAYYFIKECFDLIDEIDDDMFKMTEKMREADWSEIEELVIENLDADDIEDEEIREEIMKIFSNLYEVRDYRHMFIIN